MGSSYVTHAAGYVDYGGPKLVTSRFGRLRTPTPSPVPRPPAATSG